MRVLYYAEPKWGLTGGPDNVALYLTKALSKKLSITYFPFSALSKNYVKNLLNVFTQFARKDFDIIHFNYVPALTNGSYMLLELCNRMGYPVVLNIHGIIPLESEIEMKGSPPFWSLAAALRSCKLADAIVANSKYMKTKLETFYGVDPDKIVVIPNGIDLTMFTGHSNKLLLQGDPSILFLGYPGRMKGVDILLQAIASLKSELPDMRLHLVGWAQESSDQEMVNKLGIEKFVVFHGGVSHKMVPLYFRSADICVFPSRHEGFPLTVLEAMASGTPIIASNIDIFRDVLNEGERGLLFDLADPSTLANSILALYRNLPLRRKLSQAALRLVPKYSWENIADMYISLYHRLRQ